MTSIFNYFSSFFYSSSFPTELKTDIETQNYNLNPQKTINKDISKNVYLFDKMNVSFVSSLPKDPKTYLRKSPGIRVYIPPENTFVNNLNLMKSKLKPLI